MSSCPAYQLAVRQGAAHLLVSERLLARVVREESHAGLEASPDNLSSSTRVQAADALCPNRVLENLDGTPTLGVLAIGQPPSYHSQPLILAETWS